MTNHYELLGVDFDADNETIRAAYAARSHDILNALMYATLGERAGMQAQLAAVEDARTVLLDPAQRETYDASLAEESFDDAAADDDVVDDEVVDDEVDDDTDDDDDEVEPETMSVRDFYADDRRARSREVDFGSWTGEGTGPWKVVWVEATGELVAFDEDTALGTSGSDITDIVRDLVVRRGDVVTILAREPNLGRVRAALAGWETEQRDPEGLAWLWERCDALQGA